MTVHPCKNKLLQFHIFVFNLAPFPEFADQTDSGEEASGRHDSTSHQVLLIFNPFSPKPQDIIMYKISLLNVTHFFRLF